MAMSDTQMMSAPDPKVIAQIMARNAHHEAGHAVAIVLVGAELVHVWIATDWPPTDWDSAGGNTRSRQQPHHQPFTTFAGPWAEAMWRATHEPDFDGLADLEWALEAAWEETADGDAEVYDRLVAELNEEAASRGFGTIGRAWEDDWIDQLTPMWPAVCEVAQWLIDGQTVTHAMVAGAIARAREAGDDDA